MDDDPPKPLEPIVLVDRPEPPPLPPVHRPPRRRLAVILFLVTCLSTFFAGSNQFGVARTEIDPATGRVFKVVTKDPRTGETSDVIDWTRTLYNGLTYAAAVMVMLAAHEMGHYLQARRYHVPASLPMFIPMP